MPTVAVPDTNGYWKRMKCREKKLSFQEYQTQLYMLLVFLEDELQAYATECFVKEQVKIIDDVIDFFRLKEFYNQISRIVGEKFMEGLNLRLKKRFLLAPIAAVFAQGFTDELFDRLRCRDHNELLVSISSLW